MAKTRFFCGDGDGRSSSSSSRRSNYNDRNFPLPLLVDASHSGYGGFRCDPSRRTLFPHSSSRSYHRTATTTIIINNSDNGGGSSVSSRTAVIVCFKNDRGKFPAVFPVARELDLCTAHAQWPFRRPEKVSPLITRMVAEKKPTFDESSEISAKGKNSRIRQLMSRLYESKPEFS